MSKRVLVLVEGQTEERFVKDVLVPFFCQKNIYLIPTILITSRVKDGAQFKGGISNYSKFKNDLRKLLQGAGDALVTTMIDYHRLPQDFPGMKTRPDSNFMERVKHIETEIAKDINNKNFLPYLSLHEFEALLFSSAKELASVMIAKSKQSEDIKKIVNEFENPEEIDERPEQAPSKRILKLFLDYKKTLHGPIIAKRIGLENIRGKCQHFDEWLIKIEDFSLKGAY